MLDKYFGFLRVYDEFTVMESLIDHNRIDEEELRLLVQIVEAFTENKLEIIEEYYQKIQNINTESAQIFETISDQVIQANFDHQKQYDLLRLHQRIENISSLILLNATRLRITKNINAELPRELHEDFKRISKDILEIHKLYMMALKRFSNNKKEVIQCIHTVEEYEEKFQASIAESIEKLYILGNSQNLPIGNFMIINDVLNHMSELGYSIKIAATSIDWLLINS